MIGYWININLWTLSQPMAEAMRSWLTGLFDGKFPKSIIIAAVNVSI